MVCDEKENREDKRSINGLRSWRCPTIIEKYRNRDYVLITVFFDVP